MHKEVYSQFSETSNHRTTNEDAILALPSLHLYIVCDGVGGEEYGQIASTMACSEIADYVKHNTKDQEPIEDSLLQHAFESANQKLLDWRLERKASSSTTAVAVILRTNDMIVANIGDSRAYLLEAKPIKLTSDHTVAESLLNKGIPTPSIPIHSSNRLTQSLGKRSRIASSIRAIPISLGDRLFLCTDGVYNSLPIEMINKISRGAETAQIFRQRLLQELSAVDPKDNYSAIIIDINGL